MTGYPVLEHGTTQKTRWFRANRFRIALGIAVVETILIVANVLSWFLAIGIATLVFALYLVVRRKVQNPAVRQIAWTAALSQTVPVLIPLLLVAGHHNRDRHDRRLRSRDRGLALPRPALSAANVVLDFTWHWGVAKW